MRIALIYSAYPPLEEVRQGDGGADYCRILARHLAARGHEIHVVTEGGGCHLLPGGTDTQAEGGITVHRVIRDWGPWAALNGQYQRLQSVLQETGPDVILVVFPGGGLGCRYILPALVPAMRPVRPVVTSLFTFLPARKPAYAPLFLAASAFLYSQSRLILFESMFQLKLMRLAFPFLARRCSFMPTGSTMELRHKYAAGNTREACARIGLDPGKRYLAFLGVLRRNKNVELFLAAARQVIAHNPDVSLLFLGGKSRQDLTSRYQRRILRLIDDLGLENAVYFTGYLDEERFNQFLLASELCVLPFDERLGRSTLFLAMSAGLPIVTIARSAHMFLRHGESGFLVRSFDEQSLAAAIEQVLHDPGLRERLSRGALAAAEQVSWDQLARKWAELMQTVLVPRGCLA